jgi:hypothetical protein
MNQMCDEKVRFKHSSVRSHDRWSSSVSGSGSGSSSHPYNSVLFDGDGENNNNKKVVIGGDRNRPCRNELKPLRRRNAKWNIFDELPDVDVLLLNLDFDCHLEQSRSLEKSLSERNPHRALEAMREVSTSLGMSESLKEYKSSFEYETLNKIVDMLSSDLATIVATDENKNVIQS